MTPFMFKGFSISPVARNSFFSALGAAAAINDKIMVFIELNGGNDGLNTLIPLDQYSSLANHRSLLLIPENKVLKLDGTDATGLHPAMTELQILYNEGLVSVVQNVGYPEQDYSHFRSMDIWQTASNSDQYLDTGWLGRTLEAEYPGFPIGYPNPDNPDPLAIQIGSITPLAFMGSSFPMGMSISDPEAFFEFVSDVPEPTPATPYGDELAFIQLVMKQSQEYYEAIKAAAENSQNLSTKYPAEYENPLADQLRIVARLIGGGLQTPVYVVSLGGFDTHSEQISGDPTSGTHADLLHWLSEAVYAFLDDLKLMGKSDKVCAMTFSEFGRTIGSNGSLGTDHGAAAPLFVFGEGVNPGIIGNNPQIPFYIPESADVPMQYDFRSVYASVLQDWYGISNWQSLLYQDFEILPIFKSATPSREVFADHLKVQINPNPVVRQVMVDFTCHQGTNVEITLHDAQNRQLRRIASGYYLAGEHRVSFTREGLPAGVYFCQVHIGAFRVSRKVLFM